MKKWSLFLVATFFVVPMGCQTDGAGLAQGPAGLLDGGSDGASNVDGRPGATQKPIVDALPIDVTVDLPYPSQTGGTVATGGTGGLGQTGWTGGTVVATGGTIISTGGTLVPADAGTADAITSTGGGSTGGVATGGAMGGAVTGGTGGGGGQPVDAQPDLSTPFADGGPQSTMKLVWWDDFVGEANTRPDDKKWTYVEWEPGHVNGEVQRYTDRVENAYLDGSPEGHLVIHPAYVPLGESNRYTSARLETSGNRLSVRTGRVEVRAKLPAGIGSFPGILLLGTRGTWPACGELALMEQWGQDKSWFYATAYSGDASGDTGHVKYSFRNTSEASSTFHVYSLDWYDDRVVFQVDGKTIVDKPYDSSSPFASIPEYIVLDVALGGTMGGLVNNADFVGNGMDMVVDYVKVYSF
jgi:beta-glucanase (GH16 family)